MRLGRYMRELWRSKVGLAIALALALLAATRVLFGISLFPPGLDARPPEVASASTHVLVDTPKSTMFDLSEDVYRINSLATRAVILGNVMASPPVRDFIARRVGIDPATITATGPLTPEQPRAIVGPESEPRVSDLVKGTQEYRLNIQANPTVPILDIYAQAPNAAAATALADGAVAGLRDYLGIVAKERPTTDADEIELQQLGRARGGVINDGAGITIAVLVFALVFIAASAVVLFVGRVRRGWAESERVNGPPARGLT